MKRIILVLALFAAVALAEEEEPQNKINSTAPSIGLNAGSGSVQFKSDANLAGNIKVNSNVQQQLDALVNRRRNSISGRLNLEHNASINPSLGLRGLRERLCEQGLRHSLSSSISGSMPSLPSMPSIKVESN